MDKNSLDQVRRDLADLTVKVGKKRDELRNLLTDIEALAESIREASDEGLSEALRSLETAHRALDRSVIDPLSQYA